MNKPRYYIETGSVRSCWLFTKKYYVRIVSNHTGNVIATIWTCKTRREANELAYNLKDELQFAPLFFK